MSPDVQSSELGRVRSRLDRRAAALLLTISIAIVCGPILAQGLTSGGDLGEHVRLADAYRESILSGKIFPDWTLDNHGRGSVAVRVYPPVVPLITAMLWLSVGDLYWSYAISLSFWLFLSMAGTYLLVRDIASEGAALAGAVACGLGPHHLALIFKFSFYAEFAAIGILPLCFIALKSLLEGNRLIHALGLAVSFSLLILTHLPLSLIGIPALMVFGTALSPGARRIIEILPNLLLSITLSLLLTSVFWLRWICEREWIAHFNADYTTGLFSFEKWLFPVNVFVERALPRVPSTLFLNSEVLLSVFPVIAGMLGWFLMRKHLTTTDGYRLNAALGAAGSLCAIMVTWIGYPIWAAVGLLQKIQFPFRFLTVISFLGGALVALLIVQSRKMPNRGRGMVLVTLALFFAATIVFDVRMIFFNPFRKNASETASFAADLRKRTGPPWWLPVDASNRSLNEDLPTFSRSGERAVEVVKFDADERSYSVAAGSEGDQLDTATYGYPYWKVEINGERTQPELDPNGVMVVPLPHEASRINATFSEPASYRVAKVASLIGWILTLSAIMACSIFKRMQVSLPPSVL